MIQITKDKKSNDCYIITKTDNEGYHKQLSVTSEDVSELVNQVTGVLLQPFTFNAILEEMCELHKRKNHDYGDSFTKIFAEEGWPYAVGHLKEKMFRIDQLRKKDPLVTGESIRDSLIDLASYAVMTIAELDKGFEKR